MSARERRTYGDIVVVGGGCYGSYYVRQLTRARGADAIAFDRVVVVDHDPACAVARDDTIATVVVAEWDAFFDEYLSGATADTRDAIVPSPLMPHLMFLWLLRRAQRRWPSRDVVSKPLAATPPTPWNSEAPDGTRYASYATWVCPINCVEPAICPHTRGERSWTMPAAARELVEGSRATGEPLAGPVIFHCTHRAFGVGMFDTRDVVAGDDFVRSAADRAPADVLIGTVSHCHGAFNVLHVGPHPV